MTSSPARISLTAFGIFVLLVSCLTAQTPGLITVPGSAAWAATWEEPGAGGSSATWFVVSPDGHLTSPPKQASYELLLRYGHHDPLVERPVVPAWLDTSSSGNLWIVQYWTQGLEAYRQVIRNYGGQIHLFLANNANVVELGPHAISAIQALPFVRSVSCFHGAYRLDAELLRDQERGWSETPTRRVNILTTRRGRAGQEPVAARVRSLGGRVESTSPETHLMSATVSFQAITALACMDEVQWIDPWGAPEEDMNIARAFHGADYVQTQGNYRGQGVRVEVLDGGCDTGHGDLQNFQIHGTNTPGSHGTCTSGIVLGTGLGNANATGVAPDAFLIIGDYSGLSGSRYNHTMELQNPALTWKAVLQSNSWGSSRTTTYTSVSQDLDLILFDHSRITITQSQSNAGNQDSRPQAWAKNIVAVGGIRHYNTSTKSDDAWNSGASIGPAADGRIKPDLASFYDSTLCTDRPGSSGYSSTDYYSSFGGTSGATPIVAGHMTLLYQMWSDGVFGNATPGASVFDNRPFNTTMKALVINTASQWTFSGTTHDLTRTHQGWGHPDLQRAWDLRNDMFIVDESDVLSNLGSTTHSLTVAPGTAEFKATLVFRDNPGTTSSSQHRINNLDLKVTSPGGTVYWGNNGLLGAMWSTSGGSANSKDTVENVFVQNPLAGTWQVQVIAAELNLDTHVETTPLDADYALVVTGVDPAGSTVTTANFLATPTSGSIPLVVSFQDLSSGGPTTWLWDFGDGTTSTAQHPVHTYTSAGTYDVSLTATGPNGSDVHVKTGYISAIVPPPVAQFMATPLSGTAPLAVQFIDLSQGGPTSWLWNFGDGATSTTQSPSHTYTTDGTFTVSLTVNGPTGTDTNVMTDLITVTPPPLIASCTASPQSGLAPLTVAFTDTSAGIITGHFWAFGDGATSNLANPTHTYTNPGAYDVVLIVIGLGGSDMLTLVDFITVTSPAPVADFTAIPTAGVAPLQVTFTDATVGAATSWSWDFGDGATSTAQNPVHLYATPGSYDVSLTVTGPGGSDVETKPAFINTTGPAFYASFDTALSLPGVGNVESEDIVHYDPASGNWSMHVDGSDVGLSGADINAFHVIDGAGIIMSFATPTVQVPGLIAGPNGTEVKSTDLVFFAPTALGANTAGSFLFAFDGSDVGLTASGPGIDGVTLVLDTLLVISTGGNQSFLPFGPVAGEDMLLFVPSTYGGTTTGVWIPVFDGSDVGLSLPGENIDALHLDALARSVFSTAGAFAAGPVSGAGEDVLRFTGAYGDPTSGTIELIYDLSGMGLSTNLDAVTIDN